MDTLRGRNRATSWKSDPAQSYGGPDAGDLTWAKADEVADGIPLPPDLVGLLVQFRSIESLIGGDLNDTFTLIGNTRFSGSIDGGGSTNVLDMVGTAQKDTLNLQPTSVCSGGGHTAFAGISAVRMDGRGGNDTITVGYAGVSTGYTSVQIIGSDGFDSL